MDPFAALRAALAQLNSEAAKVGAELFVTNEGVVKAALVKREVL